MVQPNPPYPKFPEQDENGVDLSIIARNLQLSPEERVRRAERVSADFLRIRKHAHRISKDRA